MDIIEVCSSPENDDFVSVVGELAKMQFESSVQVLASRYCEQKNPTVPFLQKLLAQLNDAEASTAFWCPEVGVLLTYCNSRYVNLPHELVNAQVILASIACGLIDNADIKGSVEISGQPLYFAGEVFYLGEQDSIEIKLGKATLIQQNSAIRFNFYQGMWRKDSANLFSPTPELRLVGNQFSQTWGQTIGGAAVLDEHLLTLLEQALAILKEHSPRYYLWCLTLVREITLIQRPKNRSLISGSTLCRFGGIDICMPASKLEVAEMLVHESSHQMYNLLYTFGGLVQKNAPKVYSPLKENYRPLHNTLSGFHAFSNVLLAYQEIWEKSPELFDHERLNRVRYYLEGILENLPQQPAFTSVGASIFNPLRKRISQSYLLNLACSQLERG